MPYTMFLCLLLFYILVQLRFRALTNLSKAITAASESKSKPNIYTGYHTHCRFGEHQNKYHAASRLQWCTSISAI